MPTSMTEHTQTPLAWSMHPDHHEGQYTNETTQLGNLRVRNGNQAGPALALSFELVEKMRDALCLGSGLQTAQTAQEMQYNKLADLKAKSRLSECKIDLLQDKLKSATADSQKEIESNLIEAYKKQDALGHQILVEQEMQKQFTELVSRSRHSWEAGWSKVDPELRRAFEDSGFVINSSAHHRHEPKSSETEGLLGKETHGQRENVQNTLSEVVVLAEDKFHERQTLSISRIICIGNAVADPAVEADDFDSTDEGKDLNGYTGHEIQQEQNLVLGHKQTAALRVYGKTHPIIRHWNIHGAISWATESCISSGSEVDKSYQLTEDITRTKESPCLTANFTPGGHEMILWQDPGLQIPVTGPGKFPIVPKDSHLARYQVETFSNGKPEYSQYSTALNQPLNRINGLQEQVKNLWPSQSFKYGSLIDRAKPTWGVFTACQQAIMKVVQHVIHPVLTTVLETTNKAEEAIISLDSEAQDLPIAETSAEAAAAIDRWVRFNQNLRDEQRKTTNECLAMIVYDPAASTPQENDNNSSGCDLIAEASVEPSNSEGNTILTEEPHEISISTPELGNANSRPQGLATNNQIIQYVVSQPQVTIECVIGKRKRSDDDGDFLVTKHPKLTATQPPASIQSAATATSNIFTCTGKRKRSDDDGDFLVTKHLKLTTTDLDTSFYSTQHTPQASRINSEQVLRLEGSEGISGTSSSNSTGTTELPSTYEYEEHSPMDIVEREDEDGQF